MKKQKFEFIDLRIFLFVLFFGALYGVLVFRLYDLQINKRYLSQLKKSQGKRAVEKKITSQRGTIYDSNGNILAITRKVKSMYCVPSQVIDKENVAMELSRITGADYEFLLSRMNKKAYFAWLKRKLEDEEYSYIEKKKFPGIGFREEYQRFYPQGESFCHMIGFVNIDNKGMEGLERYMEKDLRGEEGSMVCELDAQGREICSYTVVQKESTPGNNVRLTLNEVVQQIVDEELNKVMEKHEPLGVVGIVMESQTGKILGMCSKPSYNPMTPGKFSADERRNRCITDMYEPGSVFKIITTAAAVNEGIVDMNDVFFCENGAYRIARHTLHDSHPYGDLTVKQIISKSSNIGASKIAELVEDDIFYSYIQMFGFGRETGIPLPGEAKGFIRSPSSWSKLSKPSLAMGHEVLVTPLQLITAVNVIANNGYYVEPWIVEKIYSGKGEIYFDKKEGGKEKVLSAQAVEMMKEALIDVVGPDGTAKRASLKKYDVAGKTGTAQKVMNGRYSHSKFVSSFAGFVPAEDPAITILIMVDEPHKNGYYGGSVAAPAFAAIADKIMKYLNIIERKKGIYVKAADQGKRG